MQPKLMSWIAAGERYVEKDPPNRMLRPFRESESNVGPALRTSFLREVFQSLVAFSAVRKCSELTFDVAGQRLAKVQRRSALSD